MNSVRVLVADDSADCLKAVARQLAGVSGIEVVGEANTGLEALHAVARLAPDLVFMDLSMPKMGGLEATHRLKAKANTPRVVILTLQDQPAYRAAAEAAGADGFINKTEFSVQMVPLIRTLFPGDR